jgi:hypothetical protein
MRPVVVGVMVGWVFFGTWSAPVFADGGSLRLSQEKGGYRITVFSAPTPLRAGPVDLSVLVQDASTGDPLTQMPVTIRLTQSGGLALEYPATSAAATNKLLQAAQFELPGPGRWALEVQIEGPHGPAVVGTQLEAARRLPRWREMWLWISWPALVIVLFLLKKRMRSGRPPGNEQACKTRRSISGCTFAEGTRLDDHRPRLVIRMRKEISRLMRK